METISSSPLRLYVAGKWFDRTLIRSYIQQLRSAGVSITHDWTLTEEEDKKSDEDCARFAEMDLNGVSESDGVVVVLTDPTYAYRGTCVECGAALGLRKPILVINLVPDSDFNKNIFMKHPLVTHVQSFDVGQIQRHFTK